MMVDLSPMSRLTRKRNMLLQKQLETRLQILTDEYRMTKKDLEKNSRDLGVFLMCLRDKAPGLSTYGQPDTRAMNAKNILRDQVEEHKKIDDGSDDISKASKKSKEKKTTVVDESNDNERTKSPSNRSNRNEFFNKRIVLDSRRRSFLQHCLEKDTGKYKDQRRLGGAVSHTGFLSNRDTAGEVNSKPRPQSAVLLSHRSKTPRYGSDAYSEREENIRQEVIGRFEVIFDPQNIHSRGRWATPTATPLYLPQSPTVIPEEEEVSPTVAARPPPAPPGHSGYILNRRVAWSAPPRRREAVDNAASGNEHAAAIAARQNMSVTPRSGTASLAQVHRRSSYTTGVKPATNLSEGKEVEASSALNADAKTVRRDPNRPKTAPPVYQLMQKNVAAPRQQVAGILAEIQSRRADTRAMLLKSKQLKKMVKALAPEEKDDDSYSSD